MEIMEDDNATEMHESGTFDDMVKEVESHLQGLIQKHYKPPESVWESLQAFGHAINWNEPFIQIIIAFHLILFSTILWKRRSVEVQFVLFLFITATVFMAERINTYGAMHWREFASQNYFDRQGVFCSIFLSAPLLFFALVQLVSMAFSQICLLSNSFLR